MIVRDGQERLEVALLGPVQARLGTDSVSLGGPRQRALLALLALNANQLMPAERLVTALFGVDAPTSSLNSLQVAVSRLRRQLGDGDIETHPGGYCLRLDPDQLDTARFTHRAAEGHALLASGDPAAAGRVLREALGLYHGAPLADVAAFDFAQTEIERLEELRLAALMDRFDADLATGRGDDLVAELDALARQHPLAERLRGQLMLALYRSGRQSEALEVYRDTRELLSEQLGLEPSRALKELQGAILRHDDTLEPHAGATSTSDVVVCPFKGLAPFGVEDAPYFFGRERVVDALVAHLAGASFLGLIGPSGSGKSSVLQAGLLPALAAGGLPGSAGWSQQLLRVGEATELALLEPPAGTRRVVAIDQLEELFTSPYDEGQRAALLGAIAAATLDPARRLVVVVSLRADFYGRCAAYPEFASLLSANHVLLGPMKRDELARAIERPAEQAGLGVERDLVDVLVADVAGEPGALPLLSTSLVELWRERDGRLLTSASYRLSGGLRGAVARLADHAYARLDAEEQPLARSLLVRLATEQDGRLVRRRVPLEELELEEGSHAARVVSVLTDARLLTTSDGLLEVSHEALLTEWPRLRDWLDEDRVGRRLRAHLTAAAREWDARGRDPADLYRGARLASALDWAGGHGSQLNAVEREFIAASRLFDEHETLRERRQNRRLKSLLAGVGALLLLALAAGALALVARSRAQGDATIALAGELGAEAVSAPRIDQAMLLATEGVRLDRSTQTEGTLLATLLRSPNLLGTISSPILSRPQHIAISPDGRTLADSDNTSTVRFYDTSTLRVRRVVQQLGFTVPVAYTPDGKELAAFGGPGLEVRDARTLRLVRRLSLSPRWFSVPTGGFAPLVVTPDSRTLIYVYDLLASDGSDGRTFVDRWDLRTGRRLPTVGLAMEGANDAAFVDHRRELAIIGTHALGLFDPKSLRLRRIVPLSSDAPISAAAVTPDGRTVVFAAGDGRVSFLDVVTGSTISADGGTGIESVATSPDGRTVVTTADDGTVIVWDARTGQPLTRLVGHEGLVHAAAFSPDGRTLFTSSLDGAIFKWALTPSRRFGLPFSLTKRPSVGGDHRPRGAAARGVGDEPDVCDRHRREHGGPLRRPHRRPVRELSRAHAARGLSCLLAARAAARCGWRQRRRPALARRRDAAPRAHARRPALDQRQSRGGCDGRLLAGRPARRSRRPQPGAVPTPPPRISWRSGTRPPVGSSGTSVTAPARSTPSRSRPAATCWPPRRRMAARASTTRASDGSSASSSSTARGRATTSPQRSPSPRTGRSPAGTWAGVLQLGSPPHGSIHRAPDARRVRTGVEHRLRALGRRARHRRRQRRHGEAVGDPRHRALRREPAGLAGLLGQRRLHPRRLQAHRRVRRWSRRDLAGQRGRLDAARVRRRRSQLHARGVGPAGWPAAVRADMRLWYGRRVAARARQPKPPGLGAGYL